MNREFLEGLGLEKDAIDGIMKEHGKSINELKEKADKVDALESQINDYKQQIEDRDGQLQELGDKARGNEELTAQIDELKEQNETTKNEYEEKLQSQTLDFTLDKALTNAGVRNSKAVKALLDSESIKLDGEKLLGLDDQLEALKESDEYLFAQEQTKVPNITVGGNPNGGTTITKSISEMSYQELTDLKTNNPAQFAELTK